MDPGLLRLFVVPVEVTILQLLLSGGIAVFRSHFLMTNSVIIRGGTLSHSLTQPIIPMKWKFWVRWWRDPTSQRPTVYTLISTTIM